MTADHPDDRDATATALQPGPILRALHLSTARNQHFLARRCRLHLRQAGNHVTVQRLDLERVDEATDLFDQLVAAVKAKQFPQAIAAVELLRLAFGVVVMPVAARQKAVAP
jgi:hypothetical protein